MPSKDPETRKATDKRYREKNRESRNAHQKELYAKNRESVLEKQREWYANNKERRSTWARKKWKADKQTLLKRYDLTLPNYYIMLEDQAYRCPICNGWLYPQKGDIHVDHCHKTGKVRGLLHDKCNRFLGLAHDDVEMLGNAIKYLNKSGSQ